MTSTPIGRPSFSHFALLWFGFLTGPAVWALHLVVCYLLVNATCMIGTDGVRAEIAGFTFLCAAIIIAAGALAFTTWRRAGSREDARGDHGSRDAFMGLAGVQLSTLFLFATVLEGIPIFFFTNC